MLCSGDLRYPVQLQRATRADDGYGGTADPVWSSLDTIWCKIKEKAGREKFIRDRVESQAHVVFWARYRDDVLETDRLYFNGKAYNIRWINNLNMEDEWLEILTERGVVD